MTWQERLASLRPEVRDAIKKQLEDRCQQHHEKPTTTGKDS